tara:strand:- start:520 stop:744 length:225 start_codon:yes stop_codon:yes gene_type:complete
LEDNIWERNEIESPCVKICVIHSEHKLCLGCFRTRDEIAKWSDFTSAIRKKIMGSLKNRKELLKPKRKGGRSKR